MTADAAWPLPTKRVAVAGRRAAALYSAGVAAVCFPVLLRTAQDQSGTLATLAVVVITAVMAVVAWRGTPPAWLVLLDLAVVTGYYVLSRTSEPAIGIPTAGILPAYLAIVVVVLAPQHRILLGALVAIPVLVTETSRGLSLETLAAMGPGLATALACVIFVPIAERTEQQVNAALAQQAAAARERAVQEAELDAHRTAQGVLHDDVLAALRAIALGTTHEDETLRMVHDAWRSIEVIDRPRRSTNLVAELQRLDVPGVRSQVLAAPLVWRVPPEVAAAIVDACRECLRNVVRHAGVTEAIIRIEDDGERGVIVDVVDRGSGFDGAVRPASHGLTVSVRGRMSSVGGSAQWASTPGNGTWVRLRWRPGAAGGEGVAAGETKGGAARGGAAQGGSAQGGDRAWTEGDLNLAIGDPRPAVAAMIGPFAGLALAWCAVGMANGQPWWLAAWAVAVTGLGGLSIRLGERPGGRVSLDALFVTALVGVAVFLWNSPAGVLETGAAWPISLAAAVTAVGASWRPVWWPIGGALAMAALVAAFALHTDPTHSLAALIPAAPALMSCCWPALVGMTLRMVMVAVGDREGEIARQTRAEVTRTLTAQRRHQLLDERLEHFRRLVEPILGSVAEGRRSVQEDQVREEARLVEQLARAELRLPWLTTPEVADALRGALEAGVAVAVHSTSDVHSAPPIARRLLVAALTTTVWPRSVTLTARTPEHPVSLVVEVHSAHDLPVLTQALGLEGVEVRATGGVLIAQASGEEAGVPAVPVAVPSGGER